MASGLSKLYESIRFIIYLLPQKEVDSLNQQTMAKPVLTSADYNGSQLYMEWQVELPPRFTGFQIDLDDSGGGKR